MSVTKKYEVLWRGAVFSFRFSGFAVEMMFELVSVHRIRTSSRGTGRRIIFQAEGTGLKSWG